MNDSIYPVEYRDPDKAIEKAIKGKKTKLPNSKDDIAAILKKNKENSVERNADVLYHFFNTEINYQSLIEEDHY